MRAAPDGMSSWPIKENTATGGYYGEGGGTKLNNNWLEDWLCPSVHYLLLVWGMAADWRLD